MYIYIKNQQHTYTHTLKKKRELTVLAVVAVEFEVGAVADVGAGACSQTDAVVLTRKWTAGVPWNFRSKNWVSPFSPFLVLSIPPNPSLTPLSVIALSLQPNVFRGKNKITNKNTVINSILWKKWHSVHNIWECFLLFAVHPFTCQHTQTLTRRRHEQTSSHTGIHTCSGNRLQQPQEDREDGRWQKDHL